MSNTNAVTRRHVIQSMGAVAGYLLLKPRITLAHQQIQGGLTIFAAAAAEADNSVTVLARHHSDGFQLRRLVNHNESIVVNDVIESYFPENFWPLDLGIYDGQMSSVIGSSTEEYLPTEQNQWASNNIESIDEPYGPPEIDYLEKYEIERPAIWINQNVSVMDGRGIVAARVQKGHQSVEIVLRPAFEDGDHLSTVTAVVNGSTFPIPMPPDDLPVGSANAFIKPDGGIVVAVDTVSEKLVVHEMNHNTNDWEQTQVLHNAIPSSMSMSANSLVTSRQRRTNGDIVDVVLENSNWRAALSVSARNNKTYVLPAESIPIKGRNTWLVHNGNGQLQIAQ